MGSLSKQMVEDSIEHYRSLIEDWEKEVAFFEYKLKNTKRKEFVLAYKSILNWIKAQQSECQESIERLLSE